MGYSGIATTYNKGLGATVEGQLHIIQELGTTVEGQLHIIQGQWATVELQLHIIRDYGLQWKGNYI